MTEQELKDEREQAVKRGGEIYADHYMEGLIDGRNLALRQFGVVQQSEQLVICKKCGSSEMYQYTKTKDKCEDCGNIQDY